MSDDETVWPETIMLRDTKLHDDQGGGGQRIYTTAGRGYPKVRYIREDVALRNGSSVALYSTYESWLKWAINVARLLSDPSEPEPVGTDELRAFITRRVVRQHKTIATLTQRKYELLERIEKLAEEKDR